MFRLKQYIKMLLQNILLPILYRLYAWRPIKKGSVIFADAHHEEIPFSMRRMYEEMKKQGDRVQITCFIGDFGKMSFASMVRYLISFMKAYATAETVFICDYFLPVAACKKRPQTTVVQLWHSCGLMKKIAYDSGEDIPENYRGNMFGNYSLLTLSAPVCVPVHARALRLQENHIVATGVSRTDYYFDPVWNQTCQENFYKKYPEAEGKKIALWAPTFRGNAAHPYLKGRTEIQKIARELEGEWYFIIKAHPHVDAHGQVSNCTIPTEELYAVTDLLITDYSSVLFDYMIYKKPAILFAPDLKVYEEKRGFYIDYRRTPYQVAETGEELSAAIENVEPWTQNHREDAELFVRTYVGACDGHATERILERIGYKL